SGIELVKNMHKAVGVSLTDSVKMTTLTPAKVIGVDSHKGKISAGYDADIVVFDSEFNTKSVFALGKRI
ncbi:MAG TPA: N-acetylglucosamine-6-phosphate deacetylase, partial [Ruminococcaceae bacterium]|nr:N-acetylglucosamine-6-phosphate deacetylase [Oscillospiraceae bacterium]